MKLNLGCGSKLLTDYTNFDKFNFYKPDLLHDLEKFPYPFQDNSVDEIILSHVLEHLGQAPETFNNIIKELYRICKNEKIINISVPHPRHDEFISDPTHVRPITILGLSLYNKKLNKKWEEQKASNTPLGFILDVNFEIISLQYVVDQKYQNLLKEKKISEKEIEDHAHKFNNVIKEINIKWKVIK
tara:strand:+ start:82 stop:639 length:558 start_codon:yes stop_codon:yes gene_type:complete